MVFFAATTLKINIDCAWCRQSRLSVIGIILGDDKRSVYGCFFLELKICGRNTLLIPRIHSRWTFLVPKILNDYFLVQVYDQRSNEVIFFLMTW